MVLHIDAILLILPVKLFLELDVSRLYEQFNPWYFGTVFSGLIVLGLYWFFKRKKHLKRNAAADTSGEHLSD